MKKLHVLTLSILCACLFSACNKQKENEQVTNDPAFIDITSEKEEGYAFDFISKSLLIYSDFTISVIGKTADIISWSSSNSAVASVDEGFVIGLSEGSTIIQAVINNSELTLSCVVNVYKDDEIPYVCFGTDNQQMNLSSGDTYNLQTSIMYNLVKYNDASFAYSVTGDSVAVSENGIITAIKSGTSIINVSASWRGCNYVESASIEVHVL